MVNTSHLIIISSICLIISACSMGQISQSKNANLHWDFDHQLQFRQIKLTKNSYQLEVIPNNQNSFDGMAVFLLRKSQQLCQSSHYKLEVLHGIEGFNDRIAMPNYIFPSLVAKLACSSK